MDEYRTEFEDKKRKIEIAEENIKPLKKRLRQITKILRKHMEDNDEEEMVCGKYKISMSKKKSVPYTEKRVKESLDDVDWDKYDEENEVEKVVLKVVSV